MKNILITVIGIVIIGFSCKKDNSSTGHIPLVKTKWILSYIQDTKTNKVINYPSVAIKKISISFSDSSSILYFGGVCNGGQGKYSYSTDDGTIKVSELATTKIACNYDEWEVYVTNNLDYAYQYKTTDNKLEIDSKGTYNLIFNLTQ